MIRSLILSICVGLICCGCVTNVRKASDPVKIGVILPLTGVHSFQGQKILSGIEVAILKLKDEVGGDDPMPEVLLLDDKSDPVVADQALHTLAKKGVAIVIGGYSSTESLALKSSAKELEIPTIAPTASHDEVSLDNRYMFQLSYSDSVQAQALALYMYYNAKCRNLAFLLSLDEDDIYSRNLGRLTAQAFSDNGGTVVSSAGFHSEDQDFKPMLRNLLESLPDVVLVPAYAKVAGRLVAQLREIGYTGLIVGSDGWLGEDFAKNCGPNPSPAIFSCGYVDEISSLEKDKFIKLYEKKEGKKPGVNAAMGYDALNIAYAVSAGTRNSSEVLERFSRFRAYDSVSGNIRMMRGGFVRRNVYINRLISNPKGEPSFRLDTTVEPNQLERLREDFDKIKE